jgi:diguanylate cyclase (GGDEF)-like protein
LSTFIERNYREDVYQLVSLIIIDLDFFKKVNDTCGHEGGDIVLKEVAKILRSNTRSEDCVARWGGEEFVALLPNTSLDDALKVAENLRLLVERAHFEMLPDLQVTISLGVGAIEGIEPFHMLFRRVDIALYQAKVAGRNRVMRAY